MTAALYILALTSGSADTPPDLVELSRIVAPYAVCEFKRDAEVKAAHDRWLPAEQRKYSQPGDAKVIAEAARQFEALLAIKKDIQQSCGYEEVHARLRKRLLTLHPQMNESQAFWLARGVFAQLNNMNEQLLRFKAGIFPAAPPPPPAPPLQPTSPKP